MQEISGKKISLEIIESLREQITPQKSMAAILIGEDLASRSFLKQKREIAKDLNINFKIYELGINNLQEKIQEISELEEVGGVIIQLPLPDSAQKQSILNLIPKEKDLDVLSDEAKELFYKGENKILPPAVGVLDEIISRENIKLENLKVAILGMGDLIGKPIASWLSDKTKKLYLIDEGGDYDLLKKVDLIISGVGKEGLIKENHVRDGAIVIDYGYSRGRDGLRGDLDKSAIKKLRKYTPTPGGTGPILVAKLFQNFYILNKELNV